ncbi:hypothetical protein Tco_0145035, partial [Tanacetum coccineum]
MDCSDGKLLLGCGYAGGELLHDESACEDDSVSDSRL